MTAKVYSLTAERVAGEPVPEIIEMLKEWMAAAERGEVLAIAVVAVCEGNELLSSRVENERWAALVAAHDVSKHDMLMDAYNLDKVPA